MKILLDLQGGQTESRRRGIGRYTIALTRGILRNAGNHDVWVAMTGGLFLWKVEYPAGAEVS